MNGDSYSARDGRRGREFASSRGDRDERRDRPRDRDRDRDRDRGDFDAYSSSRSHRDREREDRYSGHDEERPARDRRDDMGPARHEARRSPTPVVKREPTPDLTDVVSILERKRRMTQWDIKPPGYELVTAEQAKLSGMFPLPGAPRQQAMDPTKLQAFMNQPSGQVSSAGLKASNSRQSKRLIVNNLPPAVTEDALMSFFNLQLNGMNVIEATDPCVLCQFSNDRSFAVLEFKNAIDATVALALDGISMEADDAANGSSNPDMSGLIIRRPKDYVMQAVPDEMAHDPNTVSTHVPDTVHKLCISNIPAFLTEDQVIELLAAFGKPKALVLVKDRSTEESRGIAFAEYLEPTAANEAALNTLNGMDVGGQKLKVTKASSGSTQVANFDVGITAISGLASQMASETDKGRVVQLLNMVTLEELLDNEEYEEICDDVREECTKFGKVLELKAPRPTGGSRQSAGVGKIFVKFDSTESAHNALTALAGRKFADRTVVTTYFPEENFDVGAW
ncbi:RNA recognition motif domain-containing protein [Hirsutella rhossiliensis]|uniref:Splicing factor U2AF subunit n=1 Tax=Hirsutella rhossiliensis TaxID=111463 RepID=A0A9P8SJ37_9HYPO|nr:RNA recognition motif domain-containing protein [Hirsutella rhossiliensis]KAH0963275.1 RNA recognition motif domain-containing protein [Hirsutella rhossiliensis]